MNTIKLILIAPILLIVLLVQIALVVIFLTAFLIHVVIAKATEFLLGGK